MGVYLQEEGCCRLLGRGKVIFFFLSMYLYLFLNVVACVWMLGVLGHPVLVILGPILSCFPLIIGQFYNHLP
jgi:hypothetical protein